MSSNSLTKHFSVVLLAGMVYLTGFANTLATVPPGYAVASGHPIATQVGLDILAQGGNAFDAAIAVAATLGVVAPYHSGLGGGGFWLLHQESTHTNVFLDAREVAPLAATPTMFLGADGSLVPNLSLNGGLSAAIPGQAAALAYVAEHYGKLPLTSSLAPAIRLAEQGFVVDRQFYNFVTMGDRVTQLRKYPASAAVFLKNGKPYEPGERIIQTDLGATLRALAHQGHAGFYKGEVAKKLVAGVKAAGGIWTLDDLSGYTLRVREPLVGAYHNMLVITAPPPSAGGVSLLTMLNILSNFSLHSLSEVQNLHYLIEAMRLAYWQREQFLGDPDFLSINVEKLTSAENAKQLSKLIPPDKAIDSTVLKRKPIYDTPAQESRANTTHFSIIDSQGNRVAATVTVNYIFGSSVVAKGTGVLLNDEMDDFSTKTGSANVFGIVGSDKNIIAPGKRPVSSMTPTFLESPQRVAVLGTPGGSRIPSMMLLATLAFYEGYGPITMVSTMRFHHQYLPDIVQFEPDTFPDSLQRALQAMGYHLMPLQQYYGDMQVVTWDREANRLTSTSDPRHIGLAQAVAGQESGYGVKW